MSEVRVRLMEGDYDLLAAWLEQRPDVSQIHTFRTELRCSVLGNRESEVTLLHDMIHANFRVLEFGNRSQSLEHAFLHVTKGRVQ